MEAIFGSVSRSIEQINEIYRLLSKQMYPEALYATAGPMSSRVERTVSVGRMGLAGAAVMIVATGLILAACFVHSRIREEEEAETINHDPDRPAETQTS